MSLILVLSILIRIAALLWSTFLLRHTRDWRMVFLAAMLALMVLRQFWTLIAETPSWSPLLISHLEELPGLLVSIMAFLAVIFLKQTLQEHDQALNLARENEQKYMTLINQASDGIFIADLEGNFIDVNNRGCKMLGYAREALLQMNMRDLVSEEELQKAPIHLDEIFAGKIIVTERQLKRKDGSFIPMEISAKMLPDGRLQGIARDITERKKVRKALEESEARFRRFSEATTEGIAIHDHGIILDANQTLADMLGYEISELIGLDGLTLAAPEYRKIVLEKITTGDETPYEGLALRKDGSTFPAEICGKNIPMHGKIMRVFALRDITEQKKGEKALRESEEKYRQLVEGLQEGIWVIDAEANTSFVNTAMAKMLGYTPEEMLGKHLFEFMDEQGIEIARRNIERRKQGIKEQHEFELLRKDGSRLVTLMAASPITDGSGKYQGALAGVLDITERKKTEEALRLYSERLQTLHEMEKAILSAKSPEKIAREALARIRKLVPCFRVSLSLLDYDEKKLRILITLTQAKSSLTNGTEVPYSASWIKELKRGQPIVVKHLKKLSNPSPMIQILITEGVQSLANIPLMVHQKLIGSLNLGAREPEAFSEEQISMIQEIADELAIAIQQARLYREIQKHAGELEQRVAERTRELEEVNSELESFAYSVSHDLRAPLRAMQGFSNALLEDYGHSLDDVGKDYARRIVNAANHLDNLIQDLLAYSRISREQISITAVNLAQTVQTALKSFEPEIVAKGATITVEEPLADVLAHPITLVQIISNLISNALKFLPREIKPKIKIWSEDKGEWTRFWIEDNGIGINSRHKERIFRVFERLHGIETYPGTGIGLAIVRKGIERMGGQVGVESRLHSGSRFWFELKKAR